MKRTPTAKSEDRGAVLIIVAVFMIVAMLLMAFVIDRGRIYVVRAQMQNAVDAAALAAVQETCGFPIASPAVVRQVAIDYGDANGATITAADVIVKDGPNDATTGVSVAAESVVESFFAGFAGVSETTVAARGTATRQCTATYRMVSNTTVSFSGGRTISGRIHAGQCFRATGNGGTYEAVAVSTLAGNTTTCGPPSGSVGIEPGNNTVTSEEYNVPQPGLATAYAGTTIGATPGYTKAEMDAKLAGGPFNCSNFSLDIVCAGQVTIPNNTTVTVNIITTQPVSVPNNSSFNGAVMYTTSNSYSSSNPAIQAKAGGNPATVYFAPNGLFQGTGAGSPSENAGIVIANTIDFNGGSQDATGGTTIRTAGPWRLTQ